MKRLRGGGRRGPASRDLPARARCMTSRQAHGTISPQINSLTEPEVLQTALALANKAGTHMKSPARSGLHPEDRINTHDTVHEKIS